MPLPEASRSSARKPLPPVHKSRAFGRESDESSTELSSDEEQDSHQDFTSGSERGAATGEGSEVTVHHVWVFF